MISIITPTIPERKAFLRECEASVACQLGSIPFEHVVVQDNNGDGNSVTTNRAAAAANGDWLLPLADDDLLLPRCIETLYAHAAENTIVYAPPLVTGNEDRWWFYQSPPLIPSFALIPHSLWDDLGGYDETCEYEEDRGMWTKALDAGIEFVRVDEPCWIYRQHSGNKSFNKKAVAA